MPMKNLGTLIFCLAYLFGCSTTRVKELRLGNGKQGFDLKCRSGEAQCEEMAHTLCDGSFRVHNLFEDDPLAITMKNNGLVMRLECLEDTAMTEQECSQPGVECIL